MVGPLATVLVLVSLGMAAWAGVLGGPLLAILAVLTGFALDGWVGLVATAAFMGGFVTLVARMGDGPPPDLGGDDGAVV